MNAWTFATRSFVHNWRVNLAVTLGAAIATAVMTGALIVGDSVRESLLDLTIERLGRIDEIVLADRFFREELATEIQSAQEFQRHYTDAIPTVVLPAISAEHIAEARTLRASSVTLVGCTARFWDQDVRPKRFDFELDDDSIIVNEPLAKQLRLAVGDVVTVRLPRVQNLAADSTLADKSNVSETLAGLKVKEIIPPTGIGRFTLNPSQQTPFCAFVSLATAQDALDQEGRINSILACSDRIDKPPTVDAHTALVNSVRPTLDDAGLALKRIELSFYNEDTDSLEVEHTYVSLTTDRMMFGDDASEAIISELRSVVVQPAFTYLANSIGRLNGEAAIPYSTITAIDSIQSIGPLFDSNGNAMPNLADDEIVLNEWAAADLQVALGDSITVSYFDPETTHGETTEHTETFRLVGVAPLVEPLLPYSRRKPARYVDPPAWTNDPDLTPTVPGVSDQESIDDWDPPFPFDYKRIQDRKPKDDDYWKAYRTTPKAFVSFATGKRLWESRFGSLTAFRIDAGDLSIDELNHRVESAIAKNLSAFGFQILESKRTGIHAATGTTPFNILFMAFSFFIVSAAILLLALLFRLSVEQRAAESGLLLSVGINLQTTGKLILFEGVCISLVAALIGVVLGVLYAALMITGLKTWWVDAIVTPFLSIHVTVGSVIGGMLLGIVTTCVTIVVTLWGLRKTSARQLLTGDLEPAQTETTTRRRRWTLFLPLVFVVVAVVCGFVGLSLSGESQAGAFFGTGTCVLVAGLLLIRSWLSKSRNANTKISHRFNEIVLASRNASRNPIRSVLTIGLMAAACFLIIAISAFRLAPSDEGTGGFSLIASSELPIFDDLNDATTRSQLFGSAADTLSESTVLCLRLQSGEDASCRNLYKTQRPRLIGVTSEMIEHFEDNQSVGFKFSASATEHENSWTVLAGETPQGEPIPVVLDKNTAMYSQQLYGGIGEEFERDYGGGRIIRFRVAGLLSNSVLQGSFLISEADLRRLFPDVGGYRYFLIQTENREAAAQLLEDTFQNEGFDAADSRAVLRDLLAVQNTYLSTFQSLGGLGLLLGTFGLMAVQLRNVWQRRREIALLRATGFSRDRVGRIVLIEHALLLFGGLGLGTVAAMLTVLPHVLIGGASVPLAATFYMLVLIVAVGFTTGFVAVRSSSRLPLLETLRGT